MIPHCNLHHWKCANIVFFFSRIICRFGLENKLHSLYSPVSGTWITRLLKLKRVSLMITEKECWLRGRVGLPLSRKLAVWSQSPPILLAEVSLGKILDPGLLLMAVLCSSTLMHCIHVCVRVCVRECVCVYECVNSKTICIKNELQKSN